MSAVSASKVKTTTLKAVIKKLPKATKLTTRQAYIKSLKAKGYINIGNGGFCEVFAKRQDASSDIIKVGRGLFDGWLVWAYVSLQAVGNPFVPRIKSIELHQHDADIRSENNFYVAKLERLTRTKHSLGDEIASHVEAEYLKVRERYRKDNSDTAKARSLLGYNDETSAPKPLLEVVDIIYRLTRKDRCLDHDFKSANVMLRGKQVVLTDPIYADDLG